MQRIGLTLLLLLGLGSLLTLNAQPQNPGVSLETPRQTVLTHINHLQQDHYKPRQAGRAFLISDTSDAGEVAVKLKQIIDGRGLYLNIDNIPDEKNYEDTLTGKQQFNVFPDYLEIYVEQVNGKWYYPPETVEAIHRIHADLFPFGLDKLITQIPDMGRKKFLGLSLWKYVALFIILMISYAGYQVSHRLSYLIIARLLRKAVGDQDAVMYEKAISKSLGLLIVFLLLNILMPIAQFPVQFSQYLFMGLKIFFPIILTFIVYKGVDILGVYMKRAAFETDTTLDDQVVPIIRKSLKVLVVISGFLFVLQNLNFNVTALLAGLSIGGLAVALAAQETIKNFFGSLMIFVDRPFQVGDYVKTDTNVFGVVEEVGFRSTRIRTLEKSVVTIPNGRMADMTTDNLEMRFQRRLNTELAITYDTPPDLVETFVDGVRKIIENHPQVSKEYYQVSLYNLDQFSLNVMIYCFFDVQDWAGELKGRQEVLMSIMRLAEELGVRFAFPTSTIHVEEFPSYGSLTPQYNEDKEGFQQKMRAYFQRHSASRNESGGENSS